MNTLVQIDKFRKNGIKFTPTGKGRNFELEIELTTLFERNERSGIRVFALDLVHVPSLSEELAVLLIEATARLRRRGGDLYLYNLHSRLQEDFNLFNPIAYLSIARPVSAPPHFESMDSEDVRGAGGPEMKSTPTSAGLRKQVSEIVIPFQEDQVYKACDFVVKKAQEFGFPERELSRMKIAVYEACLNAVQHSNNAGQDANMIVEVETIGDMMQINVHDRGRGFQVDRAQEYDVTEAASHRKTGGMGLHIIRKAMDSVDYKMDSLRGNKLIMIKYLKRRNKSAN